MENDLKQNTSESFHTHGQLLATRYDPSDHRFWVNKKGIQPERICPNGSHLFQGGHPQKQLAGLNPRVNAVRKESHPSNSHPNDA